MILVECFGKFIVNFRKSATQKLTLKFVTKFSHDFAELYWPNGASGWIVMCFSDSER